MKSRKSVLRSLRNLSDRFMGGWGTIEQICFEKFQTRDVRSLSQDDLYKLKIFVKRDITQSEISAMYDMV